MTLTLFATCPKGTESALAAELKSLGAATVRERVAGVSFAGGLETAYRALMWSRVAGRVLMEVWSGPAANVDELYAALREVPWEEHLRADGTLAVDFTGALPGVTNTMFGAQRVKDAVVDRFRDRTGGRPNVDPRAPDVRINVAARPGKATVALDLAGEPLHRRGYREPGIQAEAPLKENLAAALVLMAGWERIAREGGAFCDPMCGSGTLVVEAGMIAGDVAPGLVRGRLGCERWLGHDVALAELLAAEARERREAGASRVPALLGTDADPRAVSIATGCAKCAGVRAEFRVSDVGDAAPPEGAKGGLVLVNPPYGERLVGTRELYARLGDTLFERFRGWRAGVLTADEALANAVGVPWSRSHALRNGALDVALRVGTVPRDGARTSAAAEPAPPATDATEFANRLGKNLRHLRKWARREGVTCFRVYDADLPDYSMAVDLYEGAGADEGRIWAHIAEYEAPRSIDPALAEARLDAALAAAPGVLGVDPDSVAVKVRRRGKGAERYGTLAETGVFHQVAEGGSLLLVNLTDHVDTGLFLDHRPLRLRVRAEAAGARFLNLFAYTGAFTVHAAAGGAAETLTVDMSATYLDWARRNLELNGLAGPGHRFERADVTEWLPAAAADPALAGSFGLIVCDPPTFSASKRMEGTLDVQRDQAALLDACVALLAPGGTLYFSTNLRSFKLHWTAPAGFSAVDITAETVPPDFARTPRVHTCWKIRRSEEAS